jgi:MoaA/NifB/PqqE/SkfB family radical SAM enzyme
MLERSLEEVKDLVFTSSRYDVEIHWDLTMRCNYSCRYCESYNNEDKVVFKSLDEYKSAILFLKRYFGNKKAKICFLGGEPTLFKQWVELINFCFEEGFLPEITTNLSQSINFLSKKLNNITYENFIDVSWHSSFVPDHDKMVEKIEYLNENKFLLGVTIMADPDYWDQVVKAATSLESMGSKVAISQIYDEAAGFQKITASKWYMTKDQLDFMKRYRAKFQTKKAEPIQKMLINGYEPVHGESYLEENGLNKFKGLYCAVGQKRITITPNGDIYPSACLLNFSRACIGNVFTKNINKPKKPIICPFDVCRCGPDMRIEKHKNLEDFK